jgi:O-antigen/teichoic acid export membrane protein
MGEMFEFNNAEQFIRRVAEDRARVPITGKPETKHVLKSKLIRDSFNYFLSKAIPGLMGLLSVLVFVRLVGNAEYGRYSVLFAIVTACTAGLSGWLPQGILRYFSMSQTELEAARFKSATLLGSFLSIFVGALVLGVALWIERQPLRESVLGVLLLAGGMLYGVFLIELQAMLHSGSVALLEALRTISSFALPVCVVLLAGRKTADVILAGALAGYVVPLLVAYGKNQAQNTILHGSLRRLAWKKEVGVLRTIWAYGWPVGVWSMCLTSQSAIDRYFIQRYAGSANAGSYAALYDVIVRSFSLLCFPLVMSSNSLVMERWNNGDREGAVSLIRSSLKYQIAISLLFFLALSFLTRPVSQLILGSKSELNPSLVLPLAIGGFLWQVAYLVHKPLELMCLTKRMLMGMMVALALSVAGNYAFIPIYGYPAAAYVAIAAPLTYLLAAACLTPWSEFRREASIPAVALLDGNTNQFD